MQSSFRNTHTLSPAVKTGTVCVRVCITQDNRNYCNVKLRLVEKTKTMSKKKCKIDAPSLSTSHNPGPRLGIPSLQVQKSFTPNQKNAPTSVLHGPCPTPTVRCTTRKRHAPALPSRRGQRRQREIESPLVWVTPHSSYPLPRPHSPFSLRVDSMHPKKTNHPQQRRRTRLNSFHH